MTQKSTEIIAKTAPITRSGWRSCEEVGQAAPDQERAVSGIPSSA